MNLRRLAILLVFVSLAACRSGSGATALYFSEQEAGSEPVPTRMLVTEQHLRIDYGQDDEDFILFDRKAPAIYSVNRTDKTILVITPLPVALAEPARFRHEVAKDAETYPPVAGKTVSHYRLLTNAKQCYDVFAADGLLPQAVAALREYHSTIAGEHAAAMQHTPKEERNDCDLANFIFAPARHLEFGFPIRQEDMTGNVRQLVDFRLDQQFDPKLFHLPEGFRHYRASEMRGDIGS